MYLRNIKILLDVSAWESLASIHEDTHMKREHIKLLLIAALWLCVITAAWAQNDKNMITEKKYLGSLLALYPKPVTIVGAIVQGKPNWLVVGHTGIMGHDRVMVSMSKKHFTNQGIVQSAHLSINLVSREMLPKADFVGSVSGASTNKSEVFAYHLGKAGLPIIDASPLSMECEVVDNYETDDFDNFICKIVHTYATDDVLTPENKLDYTKLKPVLFEFPTYSYLATGEVIGKCLSLDKAPSICHKLPMATDGIVRLSIIEVNPQYMDAYLQMATEVGETSLRTEPGVLSMYAVRDKEKTNTITILETYASQEAYRSHIASPHFQKYKQGTLHMVKSLQLRDQMPINIANKINNFIE